MAVVLQRSTVVYEALLSAYPPDFRERFGVEMAETFAQQLSCEVQQRGLWGFARVWGSAVRELFSVALPLQMRSTTVLAAALSLVISSMLFVVFFRAVSPTCIK